VLQQFVFLGVCMGVIRQFAHEVHLSLDDLQNPMTISLILSGVGVFIQA
jgi:hypothetical protein